jgi:hypothetical protein
MQDSEPRTKTYSDDTKFGTSQEGLFLYDKNPASCLRNTSHFMRFHAKFRASYESPLSGLRNTLYYMRFHVRFIASQEA